MMKKLGVLLLTGMGMCFGGLTEAQSLEELALQFSRTNTAGSARILGMGGVQNSLGGDFSSATSNPAGLGLYNRSEFTISPSLFVISNQAGYYGDTVNSTKAKVAIPSLSYVHHFNRERNGWLGGTIAVTVTRLNTFNSTLKYEGVNPNNTIGDYFAYSSDGIDPNNLNSNSLSNLSYNTYLTSPIPDNPDMWYFTPAGSTIPWIDINYKQSFQTETIETSGKQNQWTVSYANNFQDKLFFGGGIHIRNISYSNKKIYSESAHQYIGDPSYRPLNEVILEENLRISGSGISGTIGVIGRPFGGMQIGVTYNTPTWYALSESYNAYMSVDWVNGFDYYGDGDVVMGTPENPSFKEAFIDQLQNDYKLKTPGKLGIGASYFFNKVGFVSVDVDIIDYSKSRYSPVYENDSYDGENGAISSTYKRVANFRVGGEFRIKSLRLRSGISVQPSPFKEKKNDISNDIIAPSIGLGYRSNKFYVDMAIVLRTINDSYNPYTVFGNSIEPVVSVSTFSPSLNFTVGFPF